MGFGDTEDSVWMCSKCGHDHYSQSCPHYDDKIDPAKTVVSLKDQESLQEKINNFLTKKTETKDSFVTGAVRSSSEGRGRPQDISPYAMVRFAALLERGAALYGPRNYQKGMSLCRTCGAILRHTFQYLAGDRSEDHAAAIMFNAMCLIDTEERIINGQAPKELNDIGTFVLIQKETNSTN